jgi:hypothetical protein
MKPTAQTAILCALLLSVFARAEQPLQYEPSVVEVSGKIAKGKFQHPNGEWVGFYSLKLMTPVSIKADGANPINVSESGIKEIQLYSNSPEIRQKLDKLPEREATVKGTLFHSHTAWHVRPLVMEVLEVK